MPNPHFDVKMISRKNGSHAVASAAYRSGERLHSAVASASYRTGAILQDHTQGKVFDYRQKEHVLHTEIRVPDPAVEWAIDRELLWNTVEATEKRRDAQLARDVIAALPRELDTEQQIALVRDFVEENFVSQGMIADIAIHASDASDGGKNPHTHIMLTTREVNAEGFGKKNRDWNQRDRVQQWRDSWETITNRYLEDAGSEERLCLDSYEEQGIDKEPEIHMGQEAWHLEQKGIETHKGDINRAILHANTLRDIAQHYAPPPEPEAPEAFDNLRDMAKARWYDSEEAAAMRSDVPDLKRVVQPEDSQESRESPEAILYQARKNHMAYMRHTAQQAMHATGVMLHRLATYTGAVVEKTVEVGRAIFDNLRDVTHEREQGHER